MPEFKPFLDTFKQGLLISPKDGLDYVFGTQKAALDSYRPSREETTDFVYVLISAILKEGKDLSEDRRLALRKVLNYNDKPAIAYFYGIDPHVFAFQLALRIREPSLINQSKVGICGENALMIYFAKNAPSAFAEYAISIMCNGEGKFHGLTVKPVKETFWGASVWELNKGNLAEADFVIMGSFVIGLFGSIKEGSFPEDVVARLSETGFQNIENKVNPFSEPNRQNLEGACAAVQARPRKLVMLAVWPEFVAQLTSYKTFLAAKWGDPHPYLKRGSGKKWEHASENEGGLDLSKNLQATVRGNPKTRHWILVTHLVKTDKEVTLKLYSWRDPVQGTLTLDTFMTHYDGYIAADPPAPVLS
jgi:hypothetical protein